MVSPASTEKVYVVLSPAWARLPETSELKAGNVCSDRAAARNSPVTVTGEFESPASANQYSPVTVGVAGKSLPMQVPPIP